MDGRMDGQMDGRTENIYSIFRDKLLLLGEHVLAPGCDGEPSHAVEYRGRGKTGCHCVGAGY
jgi:hypothetical protein